MESAMSSREGSSGKFMGPFDSSSLPLDHRQAVLAGRVNTSHGPIPVLVRNGTVFDVSSCACTSSDLFDLPEPQSTEGIAICEVEDLTVGSGRYQLLSPIDLQCVKACGVTFAQSAIERVIEEQSRGVSSRAAEIRTTLESKIGRGLRSVTPGSEQAASLKAALIEADMWSQYLEVAIGPDAEIFTKAPILSTVGWGQEVGIRSDSSWNNPEPEIVLVVNAAGHAVGATLGNDVNLRDFEGRSALLLGKAKDNNAACALGPFVRLFDENYTIADVEQDELALTIEGADGFLLEASSSMKEISRKPSDLVEQVLCQHQYPDGFALFLGTLFAPVQDRDLPGQGFTHRVGDIVTIRSDKIGALINRVNTSDATDPWVFGVRELMRYIRQRESRR